MRHRRPAGLAPLALAAAGLIAVAGSASGQGRAPNPADALLRQAYDLTEPRYEPAYERNCSLDAPFPLSNGKGAQSIAAKLFDNLYYVGRRDTSAWVIKTSSGLVLIDTLYNPQEAEQTIVSNVRKLGLDPNTIKLVLITHGHIDHAGGRKYFQDKGIPVMVSEEDWPMLGGAPSPDVVLHDRQVLTVGDTRITVLHTPGHTPGTDTFVFTVFDHGKPHTAAVMGGVGPRGDVAVHQGAIEGMQKMLQFGQANGLDVLLQPHEIMEDPVAMQAILDAAAGKPGASNVLILGQKRMQDYGQMLSICWQARIVSMQAGHAPVGRGAGAN